MGNGASASGSQILGGTDGEERPLDLETIAKFQTLIPSLRQELQQKDAHLNHIQLELAKVRMLNQEKEEEIGHLRAEVHKLKSVLQATVHKDGKADILATIQENAIMAGQESRTKKQGVSGESLAMGNMATIEIKCFEKDPRYGNP